MNKNFDVDLFLQYKKILIIGTCGAGKTVFAQQLGKMLNFPVIHLDKYFFQPGWLTTDQITWREKVKEFVAQEKWIMDGNFPKTFDIRLSKTDAIIYLDFSPIVCIFRIFKRRFVRKQFRTEVAPGCPQKLDWSFIKWTWNFRKIIRPWFERDRNLFAKDKPFIILKTPKEVDEFLKEITLK